MSDCGDYYSSYQIEMRQMAEGERRCMEEMRQLAEGERRESDSEEGRKSLSGEELDEEEEVRDLSGDCGRNITLATATAQTATVAAIAASRNALSAYAAQVQEQALQQTQQGLARQPAYSHQGYLYSQHQARAQQHFHDALQQQQQQYAQQQQQYAQQQQAYVQQQQVYAQQQHLSSVYAQPYVYESVYIVQQAYTYQPAQQGTPTRTAVETGVTGAVAATATEKMNALYEALMQYLVASYRRHMIWSSDRTELFPEPVWRKVLADFRTGHPDWHLSPETLRSYLRHGLILKNQPSTVASASVIAPPTFFGPGAANANAPSSTVEVVTAVTPSVKSEPVDAAMSDSVSLAALPVAPVHDLASPTSVSTLQSEAAARLISISPVRAAGDSSQSSGTQQIQQTRKRHRHAKEESVELQELKVRRLVLKNLKLELELGVITREEAIERGRRAVESQERRPE